MSIDYYNGASMAASREDYDDQLHLKTEAQNNIVILVSIYLW